jgi:ferritin-like metal-binding protein YciE
MTNARNKIIQYLDEAHASELALVRVLQSQIAMTPRGTLRSALETHLRETRSHADRVRARSRELGDSGSLIQTGIGFAEAVAGQALALGKTPIDLLRGNGGEEKLLKNVKDACATEAHEIATYTALEEFARAVGDDETARLAASIRADEERTLAKLMKELPKLTAAVVRAEVEGAGSYDIATTGAADATRKAAQRTRSTARKTARQTRKVPGATRAEGTARGAVARQQDLPIARYDALTADEVTGRLSELSQVDLAKVETYERRKQSRTTVLERISSLRGSEPWSGYDDQGVDDIRKALSNADDERARSVRTYERAHKNRAGVIAATERELANA